MNIKDVSQFTLVELEALSKLHEKIKNIVTENSDLIRFEFNDELILCISSNSFTQFGFSINTVKLGQNKSISVTYSMSPWADTVIKPNSSTTTPEEILNRFTHWVDLLRRYDKLDNPDPIINIYTQEIFSSLKVLDSGADNEPFNTKQQVAISNYLTIIHEMNNDFDNQHSALVETEIVLAKNSLTVDSKNAVMLRISKILAISKKSGLKYYKMFIDVFQKEILKKAMWAGIEKAGELYDVIKLLN